MVVAWPTLVRAKYPRDLEWRDVPCALPRYHRSLPFEGPSVDLHLSRKECHLSKQKKPKKNASCPIIDWGGPHPGGLNHPAPPTNQKTVDSSFACTSPYFNVCSNPYQLIIFALHGEVLIAGICREQSMVKTNFCFVTVAGPGWPNPT